MSDRVYKVLFVCTGNAARSQIAEALLTQLGGDRFYGASAGSHPAGRVSRGAIEVLKQHGIEWTGRMPKPVEDMEEESWDVVITVCDHAREFCPVFPGQPVVAHWGMPDPVAVEDEEARRAAFRETYAVLRRRLERFVALPLEDLDAGERRAQVEAIGRDEEMRPRA